MKKYTVTAANLKEAIKDVSARDEEHAIEKVEKFLGMALYKAQAIEQK
jgi:heterodisulfide reductase subunit A-like polyferredoxin